MPERERDRGDAPEPMRPQQLPDAETLRELVQRYDRPGPRYTSYPPAPAWGEAFGEAAFREAIGRSGDTEISLYVHVPFCRRLCSFCACNRVITQDTNVIAPYLQAIEREAALLQGALGREVGAAQLAIGGGSPNFLPADALERLLDALDSRFPSRPGSERSVELDPRSTSDEQLDRLAARGFRRMSFGVQDTSPRVQKAINRIQSPDQIRALVEGARGRGIESVNLDLIYGLPYQTVASFDETLDQVIAIRPDRIALYSYAHVTWISKAQRGFEKKDLPSADEKLAIFLHALGRLLDAGYLFLGLDHFALPGDELARAADAGTLRRNFMGYTVHAADTLLALGPSGISELPDAYAQSERTPEPWEAALAEGRLATIRGHRLSADDLNKKALIQGLMCRGEVPSGAIDEAALAPLLADGLLGAGDRGHQVTPVGRLFLRVIAMTLDAYLAPPEAGRPRYSRTV